MKFSVKIVETLAREVSVEAASNDEARDKVREMYRRADIILDDSDFCGVEFY